MTAPATTARPPWDDQTLRTVALGTALVLAALGGGLLVGQAATSAQAFVVIIPAVPLCIVAIWKRPWVTPLIAVATALLVEQFEYTIGSHDGPFTAHVPFFRSFGSGVILLPVEVLFIAGLLVWLMRAGLMRALDLPRSAVSKSLLAFAALLILGFGVGLSHGGILNIALWEVRPWMLLIVSYFLTATLLKSRAGLRAVIWLIVLCVGFKALQGTYMFFSFARAMSPRPESLLSHEESLFFGIFMVLTVGLWVYGQRGALRITASALFPFVLIADMANSRRTAWPIVLIGLCVLLAIAWVTHPNKRRKVGPVLVLLSLVCAVYFPLYWNKSGGTIAQPARALKSTVSPDPRDESSDLYREQENANLTLNIQQAGPLGKGFGTAINYTLPIADVSNFDPMIKYIPHNGLLWVWMRLGIQGEIALWVMVGTSLIAACQLARSKDDWLGLFGTVTAVAIVGYVIEGYEDLGFANMRIAIVIGCLIACVDVGRRLGGSERSQEDHRERTLVR
jgi:hypothetical protein